MQESIIDFPQDTLCPEVWQKVMSSDGANIVQQLTPNAQQKIQSVVENIVNATGLHFDTIHITGSITSNSYTSNADIDVHLLDSQSNVDEATAESINQKIRDAYVEKVFVGTHPIEVYFQANRFQDFMSVGCYDFTAQRWLVGPELKDQSFDPYSEYYKEVQAKAEGICASIRNNILSTYEKAVALSKMHHGTPVYHETFAQMMVDIKKGISLFDSVRKSRKVYSDPMSKEQALTYRASRKWKIADATFKLLDKFGYMQILKQIKEAFNDIGIENAIMLQDALPSTIISITKDGIGNADKLAENEQVDEGIKNAVSIGILASLLAIPGILPKEAVAAELRKVPIKQMQMTSPAVQQALNDATISNKMIGKFSFKNSVNILQWVYYTEAANQRLEGRKAIYSILWNRAGGDPAELVPEALAPWQFSEWNPKNQWNLVPPKKDSDWKYRVPKDIVNPTVAKIWAEAGEFAVQMLNGKWESNIGKCNMIASDKDNAKAKATWGKLCTAQIDDHRFGYDPSQDGFKTKKSTSAKTTSVPSQYTVAKGDTLSTIAKKFNITVDIIAELNGIKDRNKLSIGQTLDLT